MESVVKISLLLTLLASNVYCADDIQLPTIDEFLSTLFNTTIENIGAVANNFKYVDVDSDNITILHYQSSDLVELQDALPSIDFSKPSKIIVHGWMSDGRADWVQEMARNLSEQADVNVFTIDWSSYSEQNYIVASTAVQSIGYLVGGFICEHMSKQIDDVHIIGHSLGAHTSGFAGQWLQSNCNVTLGRITGLDPAGPLFDIPLVRPTSLQLSKDDASFVDVIHTDAGFLGVTIPHGNVDFYPNDGGPIQPGCTEDFVSAIKIYPPIVCSHGKSHEFFTETVENVAKYPAVSCPTSVMFKWNACNNNGKVYMGEGVSPDAEGRYYLNTD